MAISIVLGMPNSGSKRQQLRLSAQGSICMPERLQDSNG